MQFFISFSSSLKKNHESIPFANVGLRQIKLKQYTEVDREPTFMERLSPKLVWLNDQL